MHQVSTLPKKIGLGLSEEFYTRWDIKLSGIMHPHLVRRVTVDVCSLWTERWFVCIDSEGRDFCLPIDVIRFGTNGIRKRIKLIYPNAKIIIQFRKPHDVFECSSDHGRVLRRVN